MSTPTPDKILVTEAALTDPASPAGAALNSTFARPLLSHKTVGVAAPTEPGAFVVWSADDGYGTFGDYFALLNTKGVKGTLFLTKNWVDKAGVDVTWNDTYITSTQVRAIRDAGHEIGTHGVNHEQQDAYRLTNGDAAYHALVREAVDYLEATFGITVKTGAYPYGRSDQRTREIIARSHEFYRGTKGLVAARGQDPFDVLAIDIQTLTETAIKAYVDQAKADGSLCIFLTHGGITAADLTKFGNVIDYVTAQGVRQGTFYQSMTERTSLRGAAGSSLDTSGNAYWRTVRTTRISVVRDDNTAGSAYWDIDEVNNAPYFDSVDGTPWEFRRGVRFLMADAVEVGRRSVLPDGVTTNGSTTITSGTAGFDQKDVGRTISGAGIPAGTTIATVTNPTTATLSAAATATATGVTITIGGRPQPVLSAAGQAQFYSTVGIYSTGSRSLEFRDLSGNTLGGISQTTWNRSGTGGAMTWDTGTGGSTATIKAYRLNFIDHTAARKIALASAAPTDASMANGEGALWFDTTAGAVKLMVKAKDSAGTVYSGQVALT